MRLPYLSQKGRFSAVTERTLGLCLTGDYRNGSLGAGSHLSFQDSPGIGQRVRPSAEGQYGSPQLLCQAEGLLIGAGGRLIYKGSEAGTIQEGEKQAVLMGGRVLIFPDKISFDIKTQKLQPMEAEIKLTGAVFASGEIQASGSEFPFKTGDGVEISGCKVNPKNNLTAVVRLCENERLVFDRDTFEEGTEPSEIVIKRKIPDFEVICQSGNRLWGCSKGTIYGSKLGDPFNFFVYEGLSTDSYAVTAGNEKPFTACGQYASHIMFFREDGACKLYGTRPSNFQLMEAKIPGVRRGCAATLCTDSEDMYYLGRDGVYAYSGGVPRLLSFELGDIEAESACAAVRKGVYYLALSKKGGTEILSYDIMRHMWLPWGEEDAVFMAESQGTMHMLCRDGSLLALRDKGEQEDWLAEFRPFRDTGPRNGSSSAVTLNAFPEEGAWVAVDYSTGGQPYRQAALFGRGRRGLMRAALPPNRDGSLKIRLRGFGRCPVFSIERSVRGGSDIG